MVGADGLLLGVVGGAGPEASNKFCEILIENKTSRNDQDNIPFIHFCNPRIPDRTAFILGRGEDPVPEIVDTCKRLERAGADFLIIPCITAHAFLGQVQDEISVPLVDMVDLVTRAIKRATPGIEKVGILATTGSVRSRLFNRYLTRENIEAIVPSDIDQEELVMSAVYGSDGIKAGRKLLPKKLLTEAANRLLKLGAEAIILGCTEIPLALNQRDIKVQLYDPMQTAANEIIKNLLSRDARTVGIDSVGNLFYETNRSAKQPVGSA